VTAPLWDRLVRPVIEVKDGPFPAPIVRSSELERMPDRLPAPILAMAKRAQQAGWYTHVQYSYGHQPHATHGRPGVQPVEIWAVRMRKGDRGAVAVKTGPTWDMLYTWSPTQPWTKYPNLEPFHAAIGVTS
jgi:hypothetical protein